MRDMSIVTAVYSFFVFLYCIFLIGLDMNIDKLCRMYRTICSNCITKITVACGSSSGKNGS